MDVNVYELQKFYDRNGDIDNHVLSLFPTTYILHNTDYYYGIFMLL